MGRFEKDCPIPGCGKENVLYLSIHLTKIHGLNQTEKKPWLKKAVKSKPPSDADLHASDVSKLRRVLKKPAKHDVQRHAQNLILEYIHKSIIQKYQVEFLDAIEFAMKSQGAWIKALMKSAKL